MKVETAPLLTIDNVSRSFARPTSMKSFLSSMFKGEDNHFWVLRNISFQLQQGETFGLIGESGCGKTTLAKIIIGLIQHTNSGQVRFASNPKSVSDYSDDELRDYHKRVQMVFQNPDVSLNPRIKVAASLKEALEINRNGTPWAKEELRQEIVKHLEMVCLNADDMDKFPGELSGGEKRRLCIARALAVNPELIVADEPFTGLDISLRNQIVELILARHRTNSTTFLFITHDISTIGYLTTRIAVMYLGKLIELGPSKDMLAPTTPKHPYTSGLLAASRYLGAIAGEADERMLKHLSFEPTEKAYLTANNACCVFRDRCYLYREALSENQKESCDHKDPALHDIGGGHSIACHFWDSK